jgi:hypothetical protein
MIQVVGLLLMLAGTVMVLRVVSNVDLEEEEERERAARRARAARESRPSLRRAA